MEIEIVRGYEYDDVLIIPQYSEVNSRMETDISKTIVLNNGEHLTLEVPIFASPMAQIVESELIIGLGKLGGLGILHRFFSDERGNFDFEKYESEIKKINMFDVPFGISVGMNGVSSNDLLRLVDTYQNIKVVCIDVANGYLSNLYTRVNEIYKTLSNKPVSIMSGNVVTPYGIEQLDESGASLFRVGIGSGSLCTTRNKTGVGFPQLSAIMNCSAHFTNIVADGGIKNAGDVCKALGAGASFVMIGGWFGKAIESGHNGIIYGMASRENQKTNRRNGSHRSVEGISRKEEKMIYLVDMINDITSSLRSSMTYVGASDLLEYSARVEFVEVGRGSIDHIKLKV